MSDDEPSLVGQVRYNAEVTECIKVLGCYGYGSGGFLYAVSRPLGIGELLKIQYDYKANADAMIKSPTGMSHADVLEKYPSIECDECKGSGNSCCNGPCHKCNGDLVLRRTRFERV